MGNCKGRWPVKSIDATLVALLAGLAMVTQGQAEEYYIYHDPDGKLVISNKEPPPGSKIINSCQGRPIGKSHKLKNPASRKQTSRQKAHRSRPTTSDGTCNSNALTFLSYGLVGYLIAPIFVLLMISVHKESRHGRPLRGFSGSA
jgi:hypothetical protein